MLLVRMTNTLIYFHVVTFYNFVHIIKQHCKDMFTNCIFVHYCQNMNNTLSQYYLPKSVKRNVSLDSIQVNLEVLTVAMLLITEINFL